MDESATGRMYLVLEEFCIRTGLLALLWSVSTFLIAIGVGLLAVEVHLSWLLAPLGAGVTFVSILVSGIIGVIVYNRLSGLVSDFTVNVPRAFIVDTDRHVPAALGGNTDLLFYYFFFTVVGVGTHLGLHAYASRLVITFDVSVTTFDPTAITLYLILLFLDVGSAIGVVVLVAFLGAFYLRLFNMLRYTVGGWVPNTLQSRGSSDLTYLGTRVVPVAVREGDAEDNDEYLLTDFAVRIGLLALFVGTLAAGALSLLRYVGPSAWVEISGSNPLSILIWVLIAIFLAGVGSFFVGLLEGIGYGNRLRTMLGQGRQRTEVAVTATVAVLTSREERAVITLLFFGLLASLGVIYYALAKIVAAGLISRYPPPVLFSGTLSYVDLQLTLLEVIDVTGITAVLSFGVPLAMQLRECMESSLFVGVTRILSGGYAAIARRFAYFSGKMSGTAADSFNSSATNWIRITILVQLFAMAAILQTWSMDGSWQQPLILFGVMTIGQTYAIWRDLEDRQATSNGGWPRTLWLLVVLLVPLLGGMAYVLRRC